MFPKHLEEYIQTNLTQCELGQIETFQVRPVSPTGYVVKRGIDDLTYQLFPELLELVPRGFSILRITDTDTIITLRGMKKFTGQTPYDDDDITSNISDQIQTKSSTDVDKVQFQTKANGKMGIATLFIHNSVTYIFGGSKNVHIVRRFDQEITGVKLAERILACVQKDLSTISPLPIGVTLVGEYEDGCHIIYREDPRMVYFIGDDRLPTVVDVFPSQNTLPTTKQIQNIRNMTDIEGVVIVYYKNGQVIERKKIKTVTYVFLRVAREKFCHATKLTYKNIFSPLLKTLTKRGDSTFLNLTEDVIQYWFKHFVKFAEFIASSTFSFQDISFSSPIGMARVWHAFITSPETYIVTPKQPVTLSIDDLLDTEGQRRLKFAQNVHCPVLLIARGPSGSGKSSLADIVGWKTFCTDDKFMINGVYCFDPKKLKMYHNDTFYDFCEFIKSSGEKRAILANTALVRWEFERYSRFMNSIGGVTVVVNLNIPDLDTLCQRNTHSVPRPVIVQQIEKFKTPIYPQYYGVFFDKSSVPDYRMDTVPHVTLLFCGGSDKPTRQTFEDVTSTFRTFSILGDSDNQAGTCILVQTPTDLQLTSTLHITTSVKTGFKPADVGKNISVSTMMHTTSTISGLIGPTF